MLPHEVGKGSYGYDTTHTTQIALYYFIYFAPVFFLKMVFCLLTERAVRKSGQDREMFIHTK